MSEGKSTILRVPLNVVVTETGHVTEGILVAVMVADIDALETRTAHLRSELSWCVDAIASKAPDLYTYQRLLVQIKSRFEKVLND